MNPKEKAIEEARHRNEKTNRKYCPLARSLCRMDCFARKVAHAEKISDGWITTESFCRILGEDVK